MPQCYLTAAGSFLPGPPVANADVIRHIGAIDPDSERYGRMILRRNRINSRHYAVSANGAVRHTNAEMAGLAVHDAIAKSEASIDRIDYLAAATTQGDLLVPGHASAVHAEVNGHAMEIASFQSVCASAMMAMRTAYLQVKAGEKDLAAVTGSEFSSRWFRPGFYRDTPAVTGSEEARMAAEFLRWTLSDGAGAILLEPRPNEHRPSFKVDWITLTSLAHQYDTCMYAGVNPDNRTDPSRAWSHYDSPADAAQDGAIMLLQDFALLKRIMRAWIGEYLKLIDAGRIVLDEVDWFLCHYSAHALRVELIELMRATGSLIDEEKWFTNLPTKGNTGAAALFVMLDEFIQSGRARPGQRILCIVPESGRAVISFMMLTAL